MQTKGRLRPQDTKLEVHQSARLQCPEVLVVCGLDLHVSKEGLRAGKVERTVVYGVGEDFSEQTIADLTHCYYLGLGELAAITYVKGSHNRNPPL
jgi:hypothetical protein